MKSKLPKENIEDQEEDVEEHYVSGDEEEESPRPQRKEKKEKRKLGVVALKHKAVLDNMVKKVRKGRKATKTQAMIDAGYSKSYAESGHIKTKKSWNQLMEEYLPDSLLAKTHNELLDFKKLDYMLFNADVKDDDIYELMEKVNCIPKKIIHGIQGTHVYFWQPDGRIRKDATDMAYKVKGKMAPEKFEVERTGLQTLSDEELMALINRQKARFNKTD